MLANVTQPGPSSWRRRRPPWHLSKRTSGTRWAWLATAPATAKALARRCKGPWNSAKAAAVPTGSSWPWRSGSWARRSRHASASIRPSCGWTRTNPRTPNCGASAPRPRPCWASRMRPRPPRRRLAPTKKKARAGPATRQQTAPQEAQARSRYVAFRYVLRSETPRRVRVEVFGEEVTSTEVSTGLAVRRGPRLRGAPGRAGAPAVAGPPWDGSARLPHSVVRQREGQAVLQRVHVRPEGRAPHGRDSAPGVGRHQGHGRLPDGPRAGRVAGAERGGRLSLAFPKRMGKARHPGTANRATRGYVARPGRGGAGTGAGVVGTLSRGVPMPTTRGRPVRCLTSP